MEQFTDVADAFVGDPAAVALHDIHGSETHSSFVGYSAISASISCLSSAVNIGSVPHRSTSASTKSIAPRMANRSGIIRPRASRGIICICANDGVRMRVLYDMPPPSLTR